MTQKKLNFDVQQNSASLSKLWIQVTCYFTVVGLGQ